MGLEGVWTLPELEVDYSTTCTFKVSIGGEDILLLWYSNRKNTLESRDIRTPQSLQTYGSRRLYSHENIFIGFSN